MIITYTINADDVIVETGAGWDYFADANGAPELLHHDVIGRPLFSYFVDEQPILFWKKLLSQVRQRQQDLTLTFRCDSPEAKRLLSMHIRLGNDNHLHITTCPLKTVPLNVAARPIYARTQVETPITRCSQCNRVHWKDVWCEVFDAVQAGMVIDELGRFSVVYAICDDCRTAPSGRLWPALSMT
jgi:hypothetical protein